jgi:hypothetical protein
MVLLSVVLSVLQTNVVARLFGPRFAKMATEADKVLSGHAISRVFQSRLLGPGIYGLIQRVTHLEHRMAFLLTLSLLLAIFYTVLSIVLEVLDRDPAERILGMLSAWALSTPLMLNAWLYLWDSIDMTIMTVFIATLLTGARLRWLVLVIALEAFNREASVMMGGGLILIGLLHLKDAKGGAFARNYIIAGGVLAVLSAAYSEMLRTLLYQMEARTDLGYWTTNQQGAHFIVQSQFNTNWFSSVLRGNDPIGSFQFFLVIGFVAVIVAAWRRGDAWRKVSVVFGVLFLATSVFGIVYEWRIWLSFVPLAILFLLDRPSKERMAALQHA